MLITLLAAGSRGDTQPFVALGVALKNAGYGVRVAGSENFRALVTGQGLAFHAVSGDVSQVASNEDIQAAMGADNPLKILLSFNTLRAYAYELQEGFYSACQGADAVVYHPGAAIGYFAARDQNVPSILASPFPMTPTRDYPALVFYDAPRLGRQANLLTHKAFERVMWQTSAPLIRKFWKEKFGEAPADFSMSFAKQRTESRPTIVSCSDYVFPRPPDWPEHVYNTGYWFLDEPAWSPPADLEAFLRAGPPPVYVGFGSLSDPATAAGTTDLVVAALRRAGQRGVLATGWGGMAKCETLPDGMFVLESAPHAWLFPKMAAVVHHGGAGTTAAGFRAGVPSVVIPHSVDQFAWGRRVHELGVGSKPIKKKNLSVESLTGALAEALSEETKRAAKVLGQKIRSERGVETAVGVITGALE